MRTFRPFITTALAIALAGTVILPKALPSSTAQAAKPAATHSAVHTDLRKDINCSPVHVVVWVGSRVHVQCASSIGGIRYFALPLSSSSVNQVLALLNSAQVAGRTLSITYDSSDTSGSAFGCAASDCRTIQAVGFGN